MSKVITDQNAKIRDKIAKLLARADPAMNPSEGEAKACLLRARELMAEYKLRPEECKASSDAKVVRIETRVTCTAMTNPWATTLAAVIAEHYCCKAFRTHMGGRKVQTIGIIGLEGDAEIAQRIFEYAYDCIMSGIKHDIQRNPWDERGTYRRSCNAYGYGFTLGAKKAFEEQEAAKMEAGDQTWGLVMVVPQQVTDAMKDMGKPKAFGRDSSRGDTAAYRAMGYSAGRDFDHGARIDTAPERLALGG